MYFSWSPPKYSKFKTGGSNNKNKLMKMPTYACSSSSLLSNSRCSSGNSSAGNCVNLELQRQTHMSHYHHHHNHQAHQHNSAPNKRGKRHWGTRERSGMSFLIVIAFFAVFGIIILTEVFMIDERSHNGVMSMRHGNSYMGRLGDSMPDYDNVKEDYDLLDESILSDNKLGFIQFRDNKLKIHDGVSNDVGRYAGVLLNSGGNSLNTAGGGGIGVGNVIGNLPLIPWGKVLPAKVELTLPRYPIGSMPTDGSWQVVNGTRFKFFVFSAYYDKRDGAKLVRVVGATKTRGPERVWCRFWYVQRNSSGNTDASARPHYKSATVMARVKIIRENWNLKYSACFVLCPVRSPELEVPNFVSIVARLRTPPGNVLELRNTDWDKDFANANASPPTSRQTQNASVPNTTTAQGHKAIEQAADKIAVCVKPFHFNYDQALYLMEYLEFYALLGVSHFTFYNHTIGPQANCVLAHYINGDIPDEQANNDNLQFQENTVKPIDAVAAQQSMNNSNNATIAQIHTQIHAQMPTEAEITNAHYLKPTVTMLPWNLRMRSQKEIRTEGLFAALNDCLYRTMYRYKYLALVDLDEFIVPRRSDTLNELISSLNRRFRNRNTGAYSFQNAFFYLQFPDDPLATESMDNPDYAKVRAALVTQRKTKRRYKLHPQKQRSKYICKPEAVVEAGNHFVWEFSPGRGSINVPAQDAILQHYRVCEFGGNDCIKAPSVQDRTAMKYVRQLVQRVDAVYKHLKKPCQLPDLPSIPKNAPLKNIEKTQNTNMKKSNDLKLNKTNNNEVKTNSKNNEQNQQMKAKDILRATSKILAEHGHVRNRELRRSMNVSAITNAMQAKSFKNNHNDNKNGEDDDEKMNSNNEKNSETFKRKRKMIVFERDEFGEPIGRIEYI